MGRMAADVDHLVGEAVARSHDPLRAVARRIRTADAATRRVERAATSLVGPPAAHAYALARIAVAIADPADSPARGVEIRQGPLARQRDPAAGVRHRAGNDARVQPVGGGSHAGAAVACVLARAVGAGADD